MTTSEVAQSNFTPEGKFAPGNQANKNGVGGFQERPEDINAGGRPKNAESFVFWYRKFKGMTGEEFTKWAEDNPEEKRTRAASLAYIRMLNSNKDLKEFQEVADRSEGKAPQTLIHEGGLFLEGKLKIIEADDNPEPEQETEASSETTG